jgi:hypothetical protein
MNFGNLAANRKKKLTQKIFPTTQKRHVSPFGSNSQGCINLLKIIAGITSGRDIFIFGGENKRLRNVTNLYCQCQISQRRS